MMSKYWSFITITAKQTYYNKTALIGATFFLFVLLAVYNQLWMAIGIQDNAKNINTTFIWYLLLAELIILSAPKIERIIEDDIKSGTMAYYINKPVSFFGMRFCEALSAMSVSFAFMSIIGCCVALLLTNQAPFEWKYFPIIMTMTYLSSIINVLFFTGIGLSALWLENTRTLAMALQRFAFIFGGAIFPLTIYPQWFVDIAKWTPFYSIYYLTIKLVYDFSWYNLLIALGLNFFWLTIICVFLRFTYTKLSRKVNIYGG